MLGTNKMCASEMIRWHAQRLVTQNPVAETKYGIAMEPARLHAPHMVNHAIYKHSFVREAASAKKVMQETIRRYVFRTIRRNVNVWNHTRIDIESSIRLHVPTRISINKYIQNNEMTKLSPLNLNRLPTPVPSILYPQQPAAEWAKRWFTFKNHNLVNSIF